MHNVGAHIIDARVLALTERSFPAHLHSSLLVEEAGQVICNTKFLCMLDNIPTIVKSVLQDESEELQLVSIGDEGVAM